MILVREHFRYFLGLIVLVLVTYGAPQQHPVGDFFHLDARDVHDIFDKLRKAAVGEGNGDIVVHHGFIRVPDGEAGGAALVADDVQAGIIDDPHVGDFRICHGHPDDSEILVIGREVVGLIHLQIKLFRGVASARGAPVSSRAVRAVPAKSFFSVGFLKRVCNFFIMSAPSLSGGGGAADNLYGSAAGGRATAARGERLAGRGSVTAVFVGFFGSEDVVVSHDDFFLWFIGAQGKVDDAVLRGGGQPQGVVGSEGQGGRGHGFPGGLDVSTVFVLGVSGLFIGGAAGFVYAQKEDVLQDEFSHQPAFFLSAGHHHHVHEVPGGGETGHAGNVADGHGNGPAVRGDHAHKPGHPGVAHELLLRDDVALHDDHRRRVFDHLADVGDGSVRHYFPGKLNEGKHFIIDDGPGLDIFCGGHHGDQIFRRGVSRRLFVLLAAEGKENQYPQEQAGGSGDDEPVPVGKLLAEPLQQSVKNFQHISLRLSAVRLVRLCLVHSLEGYYTTIVGNTLTFLNFADKFLRFFGGNDIVFVRAGCEEK